MTSGVDCASLNNKDTRNRWVIYRVYRSDCWAFKDHVKTIAYK